MKLPKTSLARILIATLLVGCAVLLVHIVPTLQNPAQKDPKTSANITSAQPDKPVPTIPNYDLPVRLKIPKINVDAAISPMGLTPEGDMESPAEPQVTGWYKFGVSPGNKGSAIIAGHYGPWKNGENSVFNNLQKLHKGDKVYVEDKKGATAIFVVRQNQSYNPEANAWDVFVSNDGKAHLNLITCEGTWNERQQTYSSRLVVFTDQE